MENISELAKSVLKVSRNALVINLRFMDNAISRLRWIEDRDAVFSVDGRAIHYDPMYVCRLYAGNQEAGPRAYLHLIMHCVFRHFSVGPSIERELWNIACDMAVEASIMALGIPALSLDTDEKRQRILEKMAQTAGGKLTAERIYHELRTNPPNERALDALRALFTPDKHDLWYPDNDENTQAMSQGSDPGDNTSDKQNGDNSQGDGDPQSGDEDPSKDNQGSDGGGDDSKEGKTPKSSSGGGQGSDPQQDDSEEQNSKGPGSDKKLEEDWKKIAEKLQTDLETFSKKMGDRAGSFMQNLKEVNREKYDYTEFLKKFAVMGEVMRVNDDEFDYIFYTYGMQRSGDKRMPLIEPLEYKDEKRIREFVVAIDTSGSVQGGQVQKFITKTYNILESTQSFFSKINLHIIQCDADIQEHVKITNKEEFDEYLKNMKLKGFGGTDFRPVFETVDRMIRDKEFQNMKGLIYFTDGYGTFPSRMPNYKAAFVFVDDEDSIPDDLPPWAIRLVLHSDEI